MKMQLMLSTLLAGILVTAAACQHDSVAQTSSPQPPTNEVWVTPKQIKETGIATTEVGLRPVGSSLTATGRISFVDAHVAHVFSPVTGRVTELMVNLGQSVQRGTPLATIQSPDLGSAISDVQKADAALAAAQRDYDRQKELFAAHAAAQRDMEAAESTYLQARSEHDRAAQKSRLLIGHGPERSLQEYVLRAPIDGDIVARNVSPGMELQGQYSGGNAPELFTIGNLGSVWVLADVFEVDLPRIQLGAPVTVSVVSYPDHPFQGHVDWISGTLDPTTRTAKVRCTIDNSRHLLRPEMFATVSITVDAREKLAAPRTSVVRIGDQMVAFVDKGTSPVGGERFERRIVGIDDTQAGDYVPITRGLAPGEKVVSSGAIILSGSGQ
jgi:cobalt-zinc-cadmium efflux system membrane fusion protein